MDSCLLPLDTSVLGNKHKADTSGTALEDWSAWIKPTLKPEAVLPGIGQRYLADEVKVTRQGHESYNCKRKVISVQLWWACRLLVGLQSSG